MNKLIILLLAFLSIQYASGKGRLTDYLPSTSSGDVPAVILCPGGSYQFITYNQGTHGFCIDKPKGKEALAWNTEFLRWLRDLDPPVDLRAVNTTTM